METTLYDEKLKQFDKMIMKLAWNYSRKSNCEYDDLYQEGAIGLCKAVDAYDPSQNVKEVTFYYRYVSGMLLNYVRDRQAVVRVPVDIVGAARKMFKLRLENEQPEVLVEKMGITLKLAEEVKDYISFKGKSYSLDAVTSNENDMTLMNSLDMGVNDSYPQYILDAVDKLDDTQKEIIKLIMNGYNQTEIGEMFGRNSMYINRIMRKIRETLGRELQYS